MAPPTDPAALQEAQYEMPYHHVPRFRDGRFSQELIVPWGYTYQATLEFVLDLLADRPFESLLDVGCGDGRFLHEAALRRPGAELAGIDTDERAVAMARAFCPNARLVCGDISEEPPSAGLFDVISALEVLEHIPPGRCGAFLRGLRERLSAEGVLLLTVPSDNVPVSAKHYRHFNAESLAAALAPSFRIEQLHYLAQRSPLNRLIRCALWNRWYAVTAPWVVHRVYRWYRRRLLHAEPAHAGKLCAVCRPAGLWHK